MQELLAASSVLCFKHTLPLTWETQKPNEKRFLLGMYTCSWPAIWQTLFSCPVKISLASGRGRMSAKSYSFFPCIPKQGNQCWLPCPQGLYIFRFVVKDEFKCVVCRKSPAPFEHFGNMCSSLKPPCVHCQSEFFKCFHCSSSFRHIIYVA